MKAIYHVKLRVKNGGVTPVFQTDNRAQAAGFCKSKNEESERLGSPNRYFFDVTDMMGKQIEDTYVKDKEIRTKIGARVKELRTQQRYSQAELAEMAGITAANVCNIEAGRYSVGIDVLYRIANALGVSIELIEK